MSVRHLLCFLELRSQLYQREADDERGWPEARSSVFYISSKRPCFS